MRTIRRVQHWLDRFRGPHRRQVVEALKTLPAIPEADRMRTRRTPDRKPRSFKEWADRYDRWRAA